MIGSCVMRWLDWEGVRGCRSHQSQDDCLGNCVQGGKESTAYTQEGSGTLGTLGSPSWGQEGDWAKGRDNPPLAGRGHDLHISSIPHLSTGVPSCTSKCCTFKQLSNPSLNVFSWNTHRSRNIPGNLQEKNSKTGLWCCNVSVWVSFRLLSILFHCCRHSPSLLHTLPLCISPHHQFAHSSHSSVITVKVSLDLNPACSLAYLVIFGNCVQTQET